jgi:glyoxylase-like metal-dependent hydrolase (beta-lactamase superfamily II)
MVTIGKITIDTIHELDASKVIQGVITDATPENIRKISWIIPHYADESGNIKAVNQTFLLKTPAANILIDTCAGNGRSRPELPAWDNLQTDYLSNLSRMINPDEVDFVICTHLHFDHIGWNTKLVDNKWVPVFPNAKYVFVKAEFDYWINHSERELADDLNGIEESVRPLVALNLIKLVSTDEQITDDVRLVPTPGHTPHHVSVLVKSDNQSALFAGDVFHHPCQIAHPDWMSFDTDEKKALESRKQLLAEYSDTGTLIFGAHFSAPAGGRIIRSGDAYKFES